MLNLSKCLKSQIRTDHCDLVRRRSLLPTPKHDPLAGKEGSYGYSRALASADVFLLASSFRTLGPCSKHVLSYLSGAGLGQFRDNLDFSANHEPADSWMVTHPLDDSLAPNLCIRLDRNECLGPFAPVAVAHCSHTTLK